MNEKRLSLLLALCLIAAVVSLRLVPHPANFAPVAAVAIFGGAILPRAIALWVPLGAMMVSDAIIGFYPMMPVTWACYALIALASSLWLTKPSLVKGIALTVSSSVFFFVVTNFAVWLTSGMYALSWDGLARCYALALPFFRNTALSDILYANVLFGLYVMSIYLCRRTSYLKQSHS